MKARAITPANDQKEKKRKEWRLGWFDGLRPGEGIKKKKNGIRRVGVWDPECGSDVALNPAECSIFVIRRFEK